MPSEFVEWLTHTLRREMQVANAAQMADTMYQYLRQYRTTADVVLARDTILDLITDTVLMSQNETQLFTDEIINRYHLTDIAHDYTENDESDAMQTDSGVCPSPEFDKSINYDAAFPPLLAISDPINVPNAPTVDHGIGDVFDDGNNMQYSQPPPVQRCLPVEHGSFDGSQPRFVVPRNINSQPTARGVSRGFYPTPQHRRRRHRHASVSVMSTDALPPPFCMPRVDYNHQAMSLPHEPPSHLVPVNGHTHFAPIRSDSMAWAYCEEGNMTVAPDSRKRPAVIAAMLTAHAHSAIQHSTDARITDVPTTWDTHLPSTTDDEEEWHRVWQRQADDAALPVIEQRTRASADDWLEDEQLLAFVGSIAVTAPLIDEED